MIIYAIDINLMGEMELLFIMYLPVGDSYQ